MKLIVLFVAFFCVSFTFGYNLKIDKTPHQCGENERWNICSGCESICSDRERRCYNFCGTARCECAARFARNEKTGKCVPYAQCPKE